MSFFAAIIKNVEANKQQQVVLDKRFDYLQSLNYRFVKKYTYVMLVFQPYPRSASHRLELTSSSPITEVKQGRARLVLTWVTGWEYLVR